MARIKQTEIPMEGEGVAPVKYKDLDRLGDKFIEIRDEKAELATALGKVEASIIEKMIEKGIAKYRFGDQEITVKPGKEHVKVKTVKVDGEASEGESYTTE